MRACAARASRGSAGAVHASRRVRDRIGALRARHRACAETPARTCTIAGDAHRITKRRARAEPCAARRRSPRPRHGDAQPVGSTGGSAGAGGGDDAGDVVVGESVVGGGGGGGGGGEDAGAELAGASVVAGAAGAGGGSAGADVLVGRSVVAVAVDAGAGSSAGAGTFGVRVAGGLGLGCGRRRRSRRCRLATRRRRRRRARCRRGHVAAGARHLDRCATGRPRRSPIRDRSRRSVSWWRRGPPEPGRRSPPAGPQAAQRPPTSALRSREPSPRRASGDASSTRAGIGGAAEATSTNVTVGAVARGCELSSCRGGRCFDDEESPLALRPSAPVARTDAATSTRAAAPIIPPRCEPPARSGVPEHRGHAAVGRRNSPPQDTQMGIVVIGRMPRPSARTATRQAARDRAVGRRRRSLGRVQARCARTCSAVSPTVSAA